MFLNCHLPMNLLTQLVTTIVVISCLLPDSNAQTVDIVAARGSSPREGTADFEIDCVVKNFSLGKTSAITWSKDGDIIARNTKISLEILDKTGMFKVRKYTEFDGHVGVILTIKRVQFQHSGEYTCFVESDKVADNVPVASASINLSVLPSLKNVKREHIRAGLFQGDVVRVQEGTDAVFKCRANDSNVHWSTSPAVSSYRLRIEDHSTILTIAGVRSIDNGTIISCQVKAYHLKDQVQLIVVPSIDDFGIQASTNQEIERKRFQSNNTISSPRYNQSGHVDHVQIIDTNYEKEVLEKDEEIGKESGGREKRKTKNKGGGGSVITVDSGDNTVDTVFIVLGVLGALLGICGCVCKYCCGDDDEERPHSVNT